MVQLAKLPKPVPEKIPSGKPKLKPFGLSRGCAKYVE